MQNSQIPPINVLIITEGKKEQSVELSKEAIEILQAQKSFKIFTEDTMIFENSQLYNPEQSEINYVVSIGQNCTMMRALRLLNKKNAIRTIPIISISDGDEPIMSSYSRCQLHNILNNFIKGVQENSLRIMNTLQFEVFERNKTENGIKIGEKGFSGELEIHRDMRKSVLKLKIYTKIEGKNFLLLANVWGDGIIISTPLGSLGRNINLSGPIVYKSIECITIVPISPLSLNFRPIILPATAQIVIQIDQQSRSSGQVFADGELIFNLAQGKQIELRKSQLTSQLVKGLSMKSTEEQWISCLRDVLSWGEAFGAEKPKYVTMSSSSSGESKL